MQNRGALARNADVDAVVFLILMQSGKTREPTRVRLPILNYYFANFVQTEPILTFSLENKNNASKLHALTNELMKNDKISTYYTECSVDRYVRIHYQDLQGEKHIEYFWVNSRTSAERISDADGKKRFDEHELGIRNELLIFEKLTGEFLMSKLS